MIPLRGLCGVDRLAGSFAWGLEASISAIFGKSNHIQGRLFDLHKARIDLHKKRGVELVGIRIKNTEITKGELIEE